MRRRAEGERIARGRTLTVSLTRRRIFHWITLPAASMLVPSAAWSAVAHIASARLWPAQEYTRVILESPTPIAYQLLTLRDPHRLVLDLDGVELSPELAQLPTKLQATDPYVAAIRIGQRGPGSVRLVFDLKAEVEPQLFALAPVADFGHRVILDLYPMTPIDPMMALLADARSETPAIAAPNPPPAQKSVAANPTRPRARAAPGPRPIIIAIDPGHGGEDPGAIGPRGTYEKTVALAIGKKLKRIIDADRNMRAMLTRDDDYFVPLATRVQKARQVQADLFVSVHADAFRVPTARGSSVFALSEHGATSAAASWLAQKENSADLIGGVNLDMRDKVRRAHDDRHAAERPDQRQPQGRPSDAGRDRLDQHAAQGGRRAGRIRGAEGARHPVDPRRDRVHLQPGRGAEAAQRSPSGALCGVDARRHPPLFCAKSAARAQSHAAPANGKRVRTRTRPASGSCSRARLRSRRTAMAALYTIACRPPSLYLPNIAGPSRWLCSFVGSR